MTIAVARLNAVVIIAASRKAPRAANLMTTAVAKKPASIHVAVVALAMNLEDAIAVSTVRIAQSKMEETPAVETQSTNARSSITKPDLHAAWKKIPKDARTIGIAVDTFRVIRMEFIAPTRRASDRVKTLP